MSKSHGVIITRYKIRIIIPNLIFFKFRELKQMKNPTITGININITPGQKLARMAVISKAKPVGISINSSINERYNRVKIIGSRAEDNSDGPTPQERRDMKKYRLTPIDNIAPQAAPNLSTFIARKAK
jgi:hypothetical protein